MSAILGGLPGVLCHLDDILVFGKDSQEHDAHLQAVLERIRAAGITLNSQKYPLKTKAVKVMPPPKTVSELRRFMGMINQLGKFSPNIAEMSAPLRRLLSNKQVWQWGPDQDKSFKNLQAELTKPTVLKLYNTHAPTKISADASSYGIGAVLLQLVNKQWCPIAYASRVMTNTETRYAQIEKEALAITWACEKFSQYILGKSILLETDHKPLVPLMTYKHLDNLPPRVLRFRLRLMRFDYQISHVPGKLLYTADALSRSPIHQIPDASTLAQQKMLNISLSHAVATHLPASKDRLEVYRDAQLADSTCAAVRTYCTTGWPRRQMLTNNLLPYWKVRGELSLYENLLLYGSRIVVLAKLQKETLYKIHQGHQGIQKCYLRMSSSVWWPGVSKAMESYIKNCPQCLKSYIPPKEPLLSSPLPS